MSTLSTALMRERERERDTHTHTHTQLHAHTHTHEHVENYLDDVSRFHVRVGEVHVCIYI